MPNNVTNSQILVIFIMLLQIDANNGNVNDNRMQPINPYSQQNKNNIADVETERIYMEIIN